MKAVLHITSTSFIKAVMKAFLSMISITFIIAVMKAVDIMGIGTTWAFRFSLEIREEIKGRLFDDGGITDVLHSINVKKTGVPFPFKLKHLLPFLKYKIHTF